MSDDGESDFRRILARSPRYGAMKLLGHADEPAAWLLLPDLFKRIQSLTPADNHDDIVGVGVRACTAIMKNVGFDLSKPLHSSIWDWIVETTETGTAPLAAEAIYSLEKLGIPPICVQDQLLKLMKMPPRSHPDWIGTCRAVAFRVLLRLNEQEAILHAGEPAFVDFREIISSLHDLEIKSGKGTDYPRIQELERERRWLQNKEYQTDEPKCRSLAVFGSNV